MADDDKVRALTAAGAAGYDAHPNDCSRSIWAMFQALHDDQPYRTANGWMAFLASPNSGWHQVSVEQAGDLANRGTVVIGGLAVQGGSGHVVMVMPGQARPAGGYAMPGGGTAPVYGAFPPSASGAASRWPGAHSRGEKTVADPWPRDAFHRVTFWTRD